MNKFKALLGISALLATAMPLLAQHGHAASPHITINAVVDGDSLTLVYGSPGTKNPRSGEPRKIWGKLVPYGKVWRTGADEATLLTTDKPIVLGGTSLAPGTYSLWTLPAEDGSAKLVINKQTGQWGTEYNQRQDLGRVKMNLAQTPALVDSFKIELLSTGGNKGLLKMTWERTEVSVPFVVQ